MNSNTKACQKEKVNKAVPKKPSLEDLDLKPEPNKVKSPKKKMPAWS